MTEPVAAQPRAAEPPTAEPPAAEPSAAEPPTAEPPAAEPAAVPLPVPPAASNGAGTPVVLLHAFPLDGRMWSPQTEALAGTGTYQVIVPDLRGFGAAKEQAVEEAGMDLLADDVARLLDDRGLDRVVLGGLSLGGYVAFAFVRRHADRLSGLLLLSTRAGTDAEDARASRLAMADRVLAEGNRFMPEVMLPRLLGPTSLQERPELVGRVTGLIGDQDPRAIAAAQRGMAARPDSHDVLGSIAVPTLVVTGEEDKLTGPDEGHELAAGIPGARFLLVERAGHLVNLEQPDVVNEALLDFLAPIWV